MPTPIPRIRRRQMQQTVRPPGSRRRRPLPRRRTRQARRPARRRVHRLSRDKPSRSRRAQAVPPVGQFKRNGRGSRRSGKAFRRHHRLASRDVYPHSKADRAIGHLFRRGTLRRLFRRTQLSSNRRTRLPTRRPASRCRMRELTIRHRPRRPRLRQQVLLLPGLRRPPQRLRRARRDMCNRLCRNLAQLGRRQLRRA
jgi:hypothetical protein